jgi:aryl-alcohol dehydrogenase-like predicted oxidoreductase
VSEPSEDSIEEPLTVVAELKRQGLIRHIGLSNVTPNQLVEGQIITEIVCVQNFYNVAHRNDDRFIDDLAGQGIAYVPFFSAWRLHAATVIGTRRCGSRAARDDDAAGTRLATPALAQHPADSRNIVGSPSSRESGGIEAHDSIAGTGQSRLDS